MNRAFHNHPSTVTLIAGRPLLIVDADEVILRFADGFDRFLSERDLFLDLTTYRLHGNVKRKSDKVAVLDVEVTALLDEFRGDLDWLEDVEGATDALRGLMPLMNVVVLSNVNEAQAPARLRNFAKHKLPVPLI